MYLIICGFEHQYSPGCTACTVLCTLITKYERHSLCVAGSIVRPGEREDLLCIQQLYACTPQRPNVSFTA